jgi:cyclophilin family peptidyl-prolyl cis-trans isomerase
MAKRTQANKKMTAKQRADANKKRVEQQNLIIKIVAAVLAGLLILLLLWQFWPEGAEGDTAVGVTVSPAGALITGERPLTDFDPLVRNGFYSAYPDMVIDPARQYQAVIQTEKGEMLIELFPQQAPLTVNNFVFLATEGFYDNTTFHRVLEDFMAQAGDPTGTGTGGPGYQFGDETDNGFFFDRPGLLAMANAGPGTNGSQFFITFAPTPWLDGGHTIFGELIEGEETLNSISLREPGAAATPGDLIIRIDIYER